jgi:acetyl/propionyl-CoA carboxylase alpha subunit
VPPFYDSLLGKPIIWDQTREAAPCRLRQALGEVAIEGIKTTLPVHAALASDANVRRRAFTRVGWRAGPIASRPSRLDTVRRVSIDGDALLVRR